MPLLASFGSTSVKGLTQRLSGGSGLYSFTAATFTSGGVTGSYGPSLSQARSGLSVTGDNSWVSNTEFFNTSNGIQLWTVPQTGVYRIEATGAGSWSYRQGGYGARIRGDFELTSGEVIRILVGQTGNASGIGSYGNAAGGSFVTRSPYNTNGSILVIAGGGGGGHNNGFQSNSNGSTGTSGRQAITPGGGGGSSGNGGSAGDAGAGAGFFSNGQNGGSGRGGTAYISGGYGGYENSNEQGGFGGGGTSGNSHGGGAGGYSGGGASGGYPWHGGGGGSFNSGSNQSNSEGISAAAGSVSISKL